MIWKSCRVRKDHVLRIINPAKLSQAWSTRQDSPPAELAEFVGSEVFSILEPEPWDLVWNWSKAKCRKWIRVSYVVWTGCLVLLILSLSYYVMTNSYPIKDECKPCGNERCKVLAAEFNRSVSRADDPCEDFYHYVCAGWKQAHSGQRTSVFERKAEAIDFAVIATLRNMSFPMEGQRALEKAAGLFQSCLAFSCEGRPSNQDPGSDIMDFLRGLGTSFEFKSLVPAVYLVLDLALSYLIPTLFDTAIGAFTFKNESAQVVFSMRQYFERNNSISKEFIREHLQWLKVDDKRYDDLVGVIKTVDDFLFKLGHDAFGDETPQAKTSTRCLLHRLEKKIVYTDGDTWNSYMRKLTDGLLPGEYYAVFKTCYLETFLAKVFQKIHLDHLRIWVTFDVSRQLREMVQPVDSNFFDQNLGLSPCELYCLKHTSHVARGAVNEAYYQVAAQSEAILRAQEMVSSIENSLKAKILKSDWLQNAKPIVVRKLKNIKKVIGHSESAWYTSTLDWPGNAGTSFVKNWLSASRAKAVRSLKLLSSPLPARSIEDTWKSNSFYYPSLNAMVLGLGLLSPPFFDTIPAADYASTGHLAAHEMMHAFDVLNWQRDDDNQQRAWCSERVNAEYKRRVMHVHNLYWPMDQLSDQPNDAVDSEAIADFIGIPAMYSAFLKAPGSSAELQDMPGVTSQQLFFISFCYKFCTNSVATERYPEPSLRCNVPMKNMAAFSAAYKCPVGSPMNPEEKFSFW